MDTKGKCKKCVLSRKKRTYIEKVPIKNIDGEIWKSIIDYKDYEISNLSRVKSIFRSYINTLGHPISFQEKILNQPTSNSGYKRAYLYKDGKAKPISVHRLVAMAFIPNPENKRCVNHKDGNRFNNNVENLEWVTNSQNDLHAYANGLRKPRYGKDNNFTKLSEEQVLEIRSIGKSISQSVIAQTFCVTRTTISHILNRKIWKHI